MAAPASLGLERRNPLPAGRYWVFRIGARAIVDFDAWLTKNRGKVRLVSHELDNTATPQTTFNVFEVARDDEVIWDGPGLPDRAPAHVTSSQDVVRSPVVLEPAEQVTDTVKRAVAATGETIPLLLFVAGVFYLLTKGRES